MESHAELMRIAVVALLALGCGIVMARLRQPAIVGYILAGILAGPSGLGLVASREAVSLLAELGVLLLLFLIGMELSLRAFRVYLKIALAAVALQIGASVLVMLACAKLLGFSMQLSILLGFVVALSSTAVAIKTMQEIGELKTRVGRIVVAVLIAQDLAFLPMLLIVEHLGSGAFGLAAAGKIVAAVGLLALMIHALNRGRRFDLPFARIVIGHVDLSPLSGFAYCLAAATVFGLLGLSAPYGAFLAGLAIGRSAQREAMIESVRPVQSLLLMVFFVSIGLLIDFAFIIDNLGTVLLMLLVVTLFKTALNVGILRMLGERWQRAFLEGVMLSQLGEFSFLLAASGLAAGAIGDADFRLVVTVTALSLAMTPFWLITARRVHGLAASGISTLSELLVATYGNEAKMIRTGSHRVREAVGGIARKTGSDSVVDTLAAEPHPAETEKVDA